MHEELETSGSEIKDLSDETSSKFASFFNFCTRELAPLSPVKSYHFHMYNENGHVQNSSGYNFKKIIDIDSQQCAFTKTPRNNDMIESLMHDSQDQSPPHNKRIAYFGPPEFSGANIPVVNRVFNETMEDSGQGPYNNSEMDQESQNNGAKTNTANKASENNTEIIKKKGPPTKSKQPKLSAISDENSNLTSGSLEKTVEKKKKPEINTDQAGTGKKNREGKNLKGSSPGRSPKTENKKKYVNNEENKSNSDKKLANKLNSNPQVHREFYKKHPFSKTGTYGCKCKKTKCLKLYCECFSNKELCKDTCSCQDCLNKFEEDNDERDQAMHNLLLKNPDAFSSKIITPIQGAATQGLNGNGMPNFTNTTNNLANNNNSNMNNNTNNVGNPITMSGNPFINGNGLGQNTMMRRVESNDNPSLISMDLAKSNSASKQNHREDSDEQKSNVESGKVQSSDERKIINKKGCHCKKSSCRKKYCECFGAGILCSSETCKCEDCKNGKDSTGEGKSESGDNQVAENESESIEEGRKKKIKLNSGEELIKPLEAN